MGFIVWLVVALALWVWAGILIVSKLTDPNFHNLAFSPGAWFLAAILALAGAACIGIAAMCVYFHSH
jgi:hypothetical protein